MKAEDNNSITPDEGDTSRVDETPVNKAKTPVQEQKKQQPTRSSASQVTNQLDNTSREMIKTSGRIQSSDKAQIQVNGDLDDEIFEDLPLDDSDRDFSEIDKQCSALAEQINQVAT